MAAERVYDFLTALSLEVAGQIVAGDVGLAPAPAVLARCEASHSRLRQCIAEGRHIYGVTTGFGPLANRLIDPAEGVTLQQNLVHHLATGLGPPLPWDIARAVCLDRLTTILQGYSGASRASIEALLAVLKSDLAPVLPERGTVGASGDLTPLAHLVLALQGRGAFVAKDGTVLSGAEGLARLGLAPLSLANRDGLALVNGTSAMTGVAVINAQKVRRLVNWSVHLTAALLEVMGGRAEAWSPLFGQVRPHAGQITATRALQTCLRGAVRPVQTPLVDRRLGGSDFATEPVAGQDAYSLRCAPQVIGAVLDAVTWHDQVVTIELNGVTDNPVLPEAPLAVHGGNFMGQQIALVSDALSNALVVLAGFAERQIARVTDERLNGGLPAFLHQGPAGLNSGFMGAQVTATATVAEMRQRGPASVHSISTNGANQDVVSMGTIAARTVTRQIDNLAEVLAINALCVAQGMDIVGQGFSPAARALHSVVRNHAPTMTMDRPLSNEITQVAAHMCAADPP